MTAKRIWTLMDDRPGNQSQAMGVAQALGEPFDVVHLDYDWAARLPNLIRGASRLGLSAAARARLAPPWPALVIAAGRRIAPAARWLKQASGCRLVQIMDPGWPGRDAFDLIAIPAHDRPAARANVLCIAAAPSRPLPVVTDEERARWTQAIGDLPRPWLLMLVGGATKTHPFGADLAGDLIEAATALAQKQGASLLALTSRRSGPEVTAALAAHMPPRSYLHEWRAEGMNPFLPLVRMADAIIVTGESMSMCAEACANGGPVYIFAPDRLVSDKYRRLHQSLYDAGYARPVGGDPTPWRHPPLDAGASVAAAIRARGLL